MSVENIRIKAIQQLDGRTLGILWTDDQAQKFDVVALRRSCPCATCIDEWTHERRYCWVWLWNNISITLDKVICIVCICIVCTSTL